MASLESLVLRLEDVTRRLESVASGSHGGAKPSSGGSASAELPPFVAAYDSSFGQPLEEFFQHSAKIGGDVKAQADIVKAAYDAQRQFLVKVARCKKPSDADLNAALQPTSAKIQAVQEFRESHRSSAFFNHLSAISESIPAFGWVAVAPAPGPFVKEMSEASQFYTNRVLKDFKEKDPEHAAWVKSWIGALSQLQAYIKEYHTTGISWNNKDGVSLADFAKGAATAPPPPPAVGGPPAPPPPGPPPPPPPADTGAHGAADVEGSQKAALFESINRGADITKGLRKVTDDQKTHKNPNLRVQGPVPAAVASGKPKISPKPDRHQTAAGHVPVAPQAKAKVVPKKPPRKELEGKRWTVEFFDNDKNIVISETEMKQTIYIYQCKGCTIQVKGKVNSIVLDGCKKTAVVLDDLVSSLEVVNSESIQAQTMGAVPTISIDKTDGCMIYLSKASLSAQIVTAKSSAMNILVPDDKGEYTEFPLPEQFKTVWNGKKLVTEATESTG